MAEIERGLQWWVRYAIVPVLGSGGVAAAVVAYISRPEPAPPRAAVALTTPAPAPGAPIQTAPGGTVKLASRPSAEPAEPDEPTASAAAAGCGWSGERLAWRQRYLHAAQPGTWHVFVKSLGPNATQGQAQAATEALRDRFPDFGFLPMDTTQISRGNAAWAVVIARGLETQAEAANVVKLARACGVAADAYLKREPTS